MALQGAEKSTRKLGCAVLVAAALVLNFFCAVGDVVFRRTRTDISDYHAALQDGAAIANVDHFPSSGEVDSVSALTWKRSSADYLLRVTTRRDLGAIDHLIRDWRATAVDQHTRESFVGYGEQYILYPWEGFFGEALLLGPGFETIVLRRGQTDGWQWLSGVSISHSSSTIVYWSVSCIPG
jgi:hypothetical protein